MYQKKRVDSDPVYEKFSAKLNELLDPAEFDQMVSEKNKHKRPPVVFLVGGSGIGKDWLMENMRPVECELDVFVFSSVLKESLAELLKQDWFGELAKEIGIDPSVPDTFKKAPEWFQKWNQKRSFMRLRKRIEQSLSEKKLAVVNTHLFVRVIMPDGEKRDMEGLPPELLKLYDPSFLLVINPPGITEARRKGDKIKGKRGREMESAEELAKENKLDLQILSKLEKLGYFCTVLERADPLKLKVEPEDRVEERVARMSDKDLLHSLEMIQLRKMTPQQAAKTNRQDFLTRTVVLENMVRGSSSSEKREQLIQQVVLEEKAEKIDCENMSRMVQEHCDRVKTKL